MNWTSFARSNDGLSSPADGLYRVARILLEVEGIRPMRALVELKRYLSPRLRLSIVEDFTTRRWDTDALDGLIEGVWDEEDDIARAAITGLSGAIREPSVQAEFVAALADRQRTMSVRMMAVSALKSAGKDAAVDAFEEWASEFDSLSVAMREDGEGFCLLLTLLMAQDAVPLELNPLAAEISQDPLVAAGVTSLGTPDGLAQVLSFADDDQWELALAHLGDDVNWHLIGRTAANNARLRERLITLAKTPTASPTLRGGAARALACLAPSDLPMGMLVDLLLDEDQEDEVRLGAVAALSGFMREERVRRALISVLSMPDDDDKGLRKEVCARLTASGLDFKEVRDALAALLLDAEEGPDLRVIVVAVTNMDLAAYEETWEALVDVFSREPEKTLIHNMVGSSFVCNFSTFMQELKEREQGHRKTDHHG